MVTDRIVTVPNILSLARLCLSVVLFGLIERQAWAAATVLFVVAASTDWLDGWWARRFQQVSRLGRIFDPLVDKVIICGTWMLVADRAGPIVPWMALVVVMRELIVTAIRGEMERTGHDFSAAWSGKLKMLLQCLAVGVVLGGRAWPEWRPGGIDLAPVAAGLAWAAVVATIWSGLEYVLAARVLVAGPASDGRGRA